MISTNQFLAEKKENFCNFLESLIADETSQGKQHLQLLRIMKSTDFICYCRTNLIPCRKDDFTDFIAGIATSYKFALSPDDTTKIRRYLELFCKISAPAPTPAST